MPQHVRQIQSQGETVVMRFTEIEVKPIEIIVKTRLNVKPCDPPEEPIQWVMPSFSNTAKIKFGKTI